MEFENEGCLSFPDSRILTKRFAEVVVKDALHPAGVILTGLSAVITQHECLNRESIIYTEDGPQKIKDVVESRYNKRVLSINDNNEAIYSKIIGWHKKNNKQKKKWVKLKSSNTGPNKQLVCTEDHRCAIVSDIFNPKIEFKMAKDLKNKFLVRRAFKRKQNSENNLYNKEQLSIIFGGLLGDFCCSADGEITANHGKNQKEYAKFKANILGGKTRPSFSGYNNSYSNTQIFIPINEQTKKIRDLLYLPNKKVEKILSFVNEIALAFWFMDDGCSVYTYRGRKRNGEKYLKYIQFHTESFDNEDIDLLINLLYEKFGLIGKKSPRKLKSGTKYIICLNKNSSIKMMKLVNKYIPKCMEYKISKEYRNKEKYNFNITLVPFSCKKIKEVKYLKNYQSCLYDITVKNTHNFFANDSLVHNCGHLYGKTMFDYEIKRPAVNEKCWCNSGKKYKSCHLEKIISR